MWKRKTGGRDDSVGKLGQSLLQAHYHSVLVPITEHFQADFYRPADNAYVELKTDVRRSDDTGNMFVERWSNEKIARAGGPWHSLQNGTTVWTYLFLGDGVYWEFSDLAGLCCRVDELGLKPHRIENPKHTTVGFAVPITQVADLGERFELHHLEGVG